MDTFRRTLLMTAGALIWSGHALAQSAPAPAPAAASNAAPPTQGLSEVVVTAQRRAERLQDVPITISAYNAQAIKAQAITDSLDIQKLTPGLIINKSIGAAVPWLRGVGSISSGFGTEMPVATYIDGYYLATPAAGFFALNDVERVEVLKGPQGTLFGRNASAGVIQIITKDPQSTPKLDVGVGYASYNTLSGDLYASTAITNDLAASVALTGSNQGQGWGRNVYTGAQAFKTDEYSGEGKLQWKHDGTRVTLEEVYDSMRSDVGIQYGILPGELGPDGTPFLGRYDISNRQNRMGHEWQSLTGLKIEQEMPIGHFVSLSSFDLIHDLFSFDQNGIPGQPVAGRSAVNVELDGRARTFTQEFQLLSPSQSPFQWIIGAFYLNDHQSLDQVVHGTCVGLVCGPPPPVLVHARQSDNSYAAFGQATFNVLPRTQLTVGLRYTQDEKSIAGAWATPAPGYPNTPAVLPATSLARPGLPFPGLPSGIPTSKTWPKLTWRVALDYKFTDDVMGFVSANRGFKSGTYNITSFTNPPAAPEVLDAYEVGLKSTFLDHTVRLNGSFFYYNYSNIQLRTTSAAAPGQTVLFNAAQSTVKGVDIDTAWAPTSRLSFMASAEFLDAHYNKFPGGTCTFYHANTAVTPNVGVITTAPCNRAGASMIRAPKFSGNIGATYTWPTSSGDFLANISDSYTGSFFWDPSNRIKQNAYHFLSASVSWTSPNGRHEIQLWGKNLTDSFYYAAAFEASGGSDIYSPAAPRTFGIRFLEHF